MSDDRVIEFRTLEDLSYIEAVADLAPRLASSMGGWGPLTDEWRKAIKTLVIIAKESADGAAGASS